MAAGMKRSIFFISLFISIPLCSIAETGADFSSGEELTVIPPTKRKQSLLEASARVRIITQEAIKQSMDR